MEKVFLNETGQPLPRSLEKYEANNSFRTKILAFIGAHEFFQRPKVKDNVFPNEAGLQLPRSLEKYESNDYSFKTKFLAFIGAYEFYSPEASL
ncbi:hypothetical protein CFP56_037450, partial [Quercus suber]